jgi:dephospho-CoA kinase
MKLQDIYGIEEGINDPHIFKAIFLAGGPGSGKSFVARNLLVNTGLKTINSDDIYEYLAKKDDIDLKDPDQVYSDKGQNVRNRAKELTTKRQGLYLEGKLGLIIDGTGKDVEKISKAKSALEKSGYDTMMIFVNTSEDIALSRNEKRARRLPDEQVKAMWKQVQDNIMKFQQVFRAKDFHIVDNSGGLEDPNRKENFTNVYKSVQKFVNSAPTKPTAKAWIKANM